MGLINNIRQWYSSAARRIRAQRSGVTNPQQWLINWTSGGVPNEAEVSVNGWSIYRYPPYLYCVRKISDQLASVRIDLRQTMPDGSERIVPRNENNLVKLLNEEPNDQSTAIDLKASTQASVYTHGNGRIAVVREFRGGPATSLVYLVPERIVTRLEWRGQNREIWHDYTWEDGRRVTIADRDILHIKYLSVDGVLGLDLLSLAKNVIGGGLAGERMTNRAYANDARPGMVLEAPADCPRLHEEQDAQQFLQDFKANHQGSENAGKVGLLRFGVTAREIQSTARDAQVEALRRLSREDCLLLFGLEWIPGMDQPAAYNTTEARNASEYRNVYAPLFDKWEQELNRKLLTVQMLNRGYHFKFSTWDLIRGSFSEQLETIGLGRRDGIIGQQEGRDLLGLGPMDPNDDYSNPNTTPGGTESVQVEQGEEPTPEEPEEPETPAENSNGRQLYGVVQANVKRYLASEMRGLKRLAREAPDRFCMLLDAFYMERAPQLTTLVLENHGDASRAMEWIRDSRRGILEMAGQVRPANLAAGLETMDEQWQQVRSHVLAKRILEIRP